MGDDEQKQKKRRRGGWDQPGDSTVTSSSLSAAAQLSAISALQIPGLTSNAMTPQPSLPVVAIPNVPTMATSNLLQMQAAAMLQKSTVVNESSRIYVGSLHYEISEANVRTLFASFGNITSIGMSREPGTTRSKGFCFIEYDNPQSAEAAIATMNGFELAGRKIKVGRPFGGPGGVGMPPSQQPLMMPVTSPAMSFGLTPKDQAQMLLSQALFSPPQATPTPTPVSVAPPLPPQPTGTTPSSHSVLVRNIAPEITTDMLKAVFASFGVITSCSLIPASTTGGLQSATIRFQEESGAREAAINMKGFPLADHTLGVDLIPDRTNTTESDSNDISSTQIAAATAAAAAIASGTPLHSVILENMVSVEEAADPELKDEVAEECSSHGPLADDGVDIKVIDGAVKITVRYISADDTKKAYVALNGRFFAGRKVVATLAP